MKDLFESFFGQININCPCGASIKTDDKELAAKFIEAHKDHKRKE